MTGIVWYHHSLLFSYDSLIAWHAILSWFD